MTDRAPKPLEIDVAMDRIREAVRPFPKAAMFELAEDGFDSPFEQLLACIISIRTRDETMYPTAKAFFAQARTPQAVSRMTPKEIDALISRSAFHEQKAEQIQEIARRVVERHGGRLPCDRDVLLSFHGVGPKCANLVLSVACGERFIGVDVHVHRITNRWGYVSTSGPKQTMKALSEKLPKKYWVEINRLLVPFGKHICSGRRPRCSTCPVRDMCRRVGVHEHR